VPEQWKVTLLKRVASIQGGYAFSTNDFTDKGVQLVKISNLYQNKFSLDRQPTFVSKEVALKNTDFILKKGDLILSLTGTLGKRDYGYTVIIDQDGEFLLNQRVAKIIPFNSVISTMFVDYIMKSEQYLSQIYSLPFGTKQANLSNDNVMSASCALPSLQEQNTIVNYLDTQTAKIDTLIAKARQAIELMKERRMALISAAVTGKIDVRESK
jgi:type I restriction enzyme S subunit